MKGADIVIHALEREGVEIVFAYPGGTSMEIHHAFTRSKNIRVILPRHEQGGAFAADGYARASGKIGVALATSGPGATNLVTGIANAYMDSIPLLFITGQVHQHFIGKNAFQETDITGVTRPIVKHNYLVKDVHELAYVIKEAIYVATTGRPGPVLIDIPKNIQQDECTPHYVNKIEIPGYVETRVASDQQIQQILHAIEESEKPVIYAGGGIISSNASSHLMQFAERANIPVATTLMGIGAFPEDNPLSLKWLGMHGTVYANNTVNEADLLLAFGVRFDDRVTGKVEEFAKHGIIVHVDIDPSEINKNKVVHIPIVSDIKHVLELLSQKVRHRKYSPWHKQIASWKEQYPLIYKKEEQKILPQQVIEEIYNITKGDAIICTGVGQHQMWAGQYYTYTKPRTFITSAGLGSMGFGIPSAIGAKAAYPQKTVVDIDGDGSFLMNLQELATAFIEKIDIKCVILNNQHLGMVVQWEDRFYKGIRGHTYIGNPDDKKTFYPNFVELAKGFNISARSVSHPKELRPALEEMLKTPGSFVLDVHIPYQEHVMPMIPSGKSYKDIIIE